MSKCTKCGCAFFKSIGFTAEKVCVICGKLILSSIPVVMKEIPPSDKVWATGKRAVGAREKYRARMAANRDLEVVRV